MAKPRPAVAATIGKTAPVTAAIGGQFPPGAMLEPGDKQEIDGGGHTDEDNEWGPGADHEFSPDIWRDNLLCGAKGLRPALICGQIPPLRSLNIQAKYGIFP
jgi:hypothetical protein